MSTLTYRIRPAEERDIRGIAELERLCFPSPWSEESFRREITENELAFYLVAEGPVDFEEPGTEVPSGAGPGPEPGVIIGYAGIWKILDEGHITNVAVHPDCRRRGVGRELMVRLLREMERQGIIYQTLEVRVSNEAALRLYTDLGFREAGRRRGYYEDNGEDALIMWRESQV